MEYDSFLYWAWRRYTSFSGFRLDYRGANVMNDAGYCLDRFTEII